MDVDKSIKKSILLFSREATPLTLTTVVITGFSIILSIFDILRLTIFVDASWNYNYPYWNFVYDPLPLLAAICLLVVIVLTVPQWLELSSRRFPTLMFVMSVLVFALGLLALPLELTRALDVDKRGLFNGAVYLIENGPIDFLGAFNSLPQTAPEHENLYIWDVEATPENGAANRFAEWMGSLAWMPYNEGFASYVDAYTTQKHGPVSVFLVAPFLLLFGTTTEAALVGSVIIACLIPVVGYFTFRLYFSERLSKIGAVLIATAPGLFIWMRHAAPVPYDIITSLLVACSIYVFLRGVRTGHYRYYVATGVFVSLAGMTKLTGLLIGLPIGIVLVRERESFATLGRRVITIAGFFLVLPVVFLLAGYNFLAQYLYTIYKLTIDKIIYSDPGKRPAGSPAEALNNDLIGLVGTLYNGRWMNAVLLVLVGIFVLYAAWDRSVLQRDEYFISAALLTSFLPFVVWIIFAAGTLSRHTIVLLVPFGFVAMSGLSLVVDWSKSLAGRDIVRFAQIVLAASVAQFLINI